MLIDYSQNAVGKSIVAPYSVRARPGAPVSTPVSWEAVRRGRLRPSDFTTLSQRPGPGGDPFRELLRRPQPLPDLADRG